MARLIKKKVTERSMIADFSLNIYRKSAFPGMEICYLLFTSNQVSQPQLTVRMEGEIHNPGDVEIFSEQELREQFPDCDTLIRRFPCQKIENWTLKLSCSGAATTIVGWSGEQAISLRHDKDLPPHHCLTLLEEVEERSYLRHPYPPEVVAGLRRGGRLLSDAVTVCDKLAAQEDLFREFCVGMQGEEFQFPEQGAVMAEGFTAKRLCESQALTPLAAYNYLLYLRESPQEALDKLKKGLRRK